MLWQCSSSNACYYKRPATFNASDGFYVSSCLTEPIDLTSYSNNSPRTPHNKQTQSPDYHQFSANRILLKSPMESGQIEEQCDAEVLNAAKTLFSKRTRTLYHWMYPNASISTLKTAVASAWDKLNFKEKDFYVSQVLGRFGFSKNNVIVNPHLTYGGINGNFLPLDLSTDNPEGYEEANAAVSNLLLSEEMVPQKTVSYAATTFEDPTRFLQRKRRRTGRPPGSKNKMKKPSIEVKEEEVFENDPELHREFEQFKWMMSMSNHNGTIC
ncbi:uncharacterized protein LOC108741787 isoform X2 [Agrilus planipennis]|uniref:Uncharacterized protein LOC108741787 isoform X2 n=1 Tax=Agrilus planipennis TaxID=224129 RepID=A0A1W4X7Y8_AGRPL|nr:uncharacterized protein LOC108741787 isoform X2 [Agrilus planipennis]